MYYKLSFKNPNSEKEDGIFILTEESNHVCENFMKMITDKMGWFNYIKD